MATPGRKPGSTFGWKVRARLERIAADLTRMKIYFPAFLRDMRQYIQLFHAFKGNSQNYRPGCWGWSDALSPEAARLSTWPVDIFWPPLCRWRHTFRRYAYAVGDDFDYRTITGYVTPAVSGASLCLRPRAVVHRDANSTSGGGGGVVLTLALKGIK